MKVFPGGFLLGQEGECSEGNSCELRDPQLLGVGGRDRQGLWDSAVYRSKHERSRCPQTWGSGLPGTEGLEEEWGPGEGCGGPGLPQPALQHPLFTRQRGDPPQVLPDFDEFRGMVLFLFRRFFQLKERGEA